MDRVKSYSIKNTRNGKRIVIDVEDGPGFDRRDRVVVIREKGRPGKVVSIVIFFNETSDDRNDISEVILSPSEAIAEVSALVEETRELP